MPVAHPEMGARRITEAPEATHMTWRLGVCVCETREVPAAVKQSDVNGATRGACATLSLSARLSWECLGELGW